MEIDEKMPKQVVDSSEHMASGRQGEPSHEQDFAQDIEKSLEQMDMDMEQQESEKDIDLMPHHQEVNPLASLHLE